MQPKAPLLAGGTLPPHRVSDTPASMLGTVSLHCGCAGLACVRLLMVSVRPVYLLCAKVSSGRGSPVASSAAASLMDRPTPHTETPAVPPWMLPQPLAISTMLGVSCTVPSAASGAHRNAPSAPAPGPHEGSLPSASTA